MNSSNSFFSNIPVVTKNLIIINVIIWLASVVLPSHNGIDLVRYGGLHYITSPYFNPAQVITYMFLHGGFVHLFFNMFALFMFGITLERVLGPKRFLFYYISCGIGAALIQLGVYAIMINHWSQYLPEPEAMQYINDNGAVAISQGMNFIDPYMAKINALINVPTVGASGATYGVLLAFGVIFPNRPIYLMFIPIPIKAKWFVMGYGALELLEGLGNSGDGIAHFAHLGGMLFGLIMILYWKRKGMFNGYY